MTKGVVLLAFGKTEYLQMAAQMAVSIDYYNKDIDVSIVCDSNIAKIPQHYRDFFHKEIIISKEDCYTDGKIDPGKAKIELIKYLPYDRNIYLDVDGLCLQDLSPLFEISKFYATEVTGVGGYEDKIEYSFWASNKDIWEYFGLDKDKGKYAAIQSSFAVFNKGKQLDEYYEKLKNNWSFPMNKLQNDWGGTMPDELIFAGSAAQMNHNPDCGHKVVFFGHSYDERSYSELQERYYILSMYGNGTGRLLVKLRYRDWYDRIFSKICKRKQMNRLAPISRMMKTKHAG